MLVINYNGVYTMGLWKYGLLHLEVQRVSCHCCIFWVFVHGILTQCGSHWVLCKS